MEKFVEDAFKKACEGNEQLDKEAEAAVRAFKENLVPVWHLAGKTMNDPDGLARAIAISDTGQDLMELIRLYFYAGFSAGADHGRGL